MRTFETGATRDDDKDKVDPEGFLSPLAIEAFCQYMHKHRKQADGSLRSSDNWQKGMEISVYMKSAWRHFLAVWKGHRAGKLSLDDLCALMFNVQGMIHEEVKRGQSTYPRKDFSEAKVGDRVWSSRWGWGTVTHFSLLNDPYIVKVRFPSNGDGPFTFTADGRYLVSEAPSLFWEEQPS